TSTPLSISLRMATKQLTAGTATATGTATTRASLSLSILVLPRSRSQEHLLRSLHSGVEPVRFASRRHAREKRIRARHRHTGLNCRRHRLLRAAFRPANADLL